MAPTRDEVRALAMVNDNPNVLAARVRQQCGIGFYNTSEYDLAQLVADPDGLKSNLVDYISRFSANIDVFERFKFENEIATLAEKESAVVGGAPVRRGGPAPRHGA
jgi:type I restriction enzyme M protein